MKYNYLVVVHKESKTELVYFYSLENAKFYCVRAIENSGVCCELFEVNKIGEYMC